MRLIVQLKLKIKKGLPWVRNFRKIMKILSLVLVNIAPKNQSATYFHPTLFIDKIIDDLFLALSLH